ncbi:flagellar hook assembly protein FlgD [Aquibium sp. ELW1220]|uniref:flagellar hook assembly protein FlgD n=1 Tax=Aquibium sp. ELW1220 TaxID=2976766 RepID=UPI0025B1B6BD|nr:flagellar hook assembly protein FlgD [Aquibium sp. ELW1220]MDN2580750.1 flagellar hook assembly protein FlgD [Aquibium sp. ELW1220]
MTVPAVTSSTATTTSSQANATTVDYESFLRLLVTQMKNQDPTAPMDSTDYVAQLATFSQVEQTVQTNSKLDSLLQMSLLGQASSIIGRTVTGTDGTTGVVAETRITASGVTAVLQSGAEVVIGTGVRIS